MYFDTRGVHTLHSNLTDVTRGSGHCLPIYDFYVGITLPDSAFT